MSLLDALDHAIQETEEYKRSTDDSSEASHAPRTVTSAVNPSSKSTNTTNSTQKPFQGADKIISEKKAKNVDNDSADPNAIKIGVEKLPPLPAKGTDPAVSTAMIKLTSMLAAPDEKVYSRR
jgi:hypothetical protein